MVKVTSIAWLQLFKVDNPVGFPDTYLLNSGLAIGYCYPTFQQQDPGDLWGFENWTKFVSTCVSLVSVSHFLL